MMWRNLKNYCCPKCNNVLKQSQEMHYCSKCNFQISDKKFKNVINDRYATKESKKDNLADLNNLGHKKVTDDFSDSPFI